MDTSLLQSNKEKTVFHPSFFESTELDVPESKDHRTLQDIRKERDQRLTGPNVTKLVSPGSFKFTTDDKQISKSNTRFLFKNLFGETPLTMLFFSEKNVRNIQNLLKMNVHSQIGYIIDDQSITELMIVMRSIFLEYNRHPKLITPDLPKDELETLLKKYTDEVSRLNKLVVDAILPKLVSQIQQYISYLKDASEQPYYMDKPVNESVQGQKEYRSVTQVLLGGEF